jgi:hypothetical protein
MNKEKDKVEQLEMEKAKKKEEHKREKKREKIRQELLKGVQTTSTPGNEEIDKEKVISAIAEEMLKVLSKWPEEIQALVSTDQPNKKSFINGIGYVVGAYLQRARQVLHKQTLDGIRAKEMEIAKLMGPLSDLAGRLKKTQQKVNEDEISRLKIEKETRIREAAAAISREYNEKIHKIRGGQSEALDAIDEKIKRLSNEYNNTKADLESNQELLLSVITDLGKPYDLAEPLPVKMSKEVNMALAVGAAVAAP